MNLFNIIDMFQYDDKMYYIYVSIVVLIAIFLSFVIIWNSDIFDRQNKKGEFKVGDETLERVKNFQKMEREKYYEGIQINSLGFKDDTNWTTKKLQGQYRIVALGDSMTEGTGVGTQSTWPEQLENKLNKHYGKEKFEVMNFAPTKLDSGTPEEYSVLKNKSLKYSPDMIILQYYSNDWRSVNVKERAKEKWGKYLKGEYTLPEEIKKSLEGNNISKSTASRIIYEIELEKYYERKDRKEEWDRWVKPYLIKMIEISKNKDIPLRVITWDSIDWQNKKLKSILNKHNISLHDFSEDLPLKRSSKYRLPDGHLSGYGYGVVANRTFNGIRGDLKL